ncbi:hypothetical protein RADP37_05494 (plasmid) [Roseomonas mucosa]|uniref:Uncharacterized protein n=2 Tax=Roseomonas mucosa TaxID=207340 RepID=A0A4Y1MPT1_9PROT|nr:hypothetical protein RADP37_05494 [Roseomonas mucosa]
MHGAAAFERYERQVTEAEIAKQMPRELRQAERLAQLQEQQQAAARSKEHGHENTHGSKR